jgi:sensor histidine kinase YesM
MTQKDRKTNKQITYLILMDFKKLRKLKVNDKIKINNQIFRIANIEPELEVIEYYLEEEKTRLEFMLQVPEEKDNEEMLVFYKVFRHGKDMKYLSVGFKKQVEFL